MNQPPSDPYSPPSFDPLLEAQQRSGWPKVIGIIGMFFGGFALLTGMFNALAKGIMEKQFQSMGISEDVLAHHATLLHIVPPVSASLGFLLLLGSILLVLRKPSSRPLLLIWALLKIGFAFWQAPLALAFQKEILPLQMKLIAATAKQNPAAPDLGSMMESFGNVALIFSVVWYGALPIFLLIWFLRSNIRTEVAHW